MQQASSGLAPSKARTIGISQMQTEPGNREKMQGRKKGNLEMMHTGQRVKREGIFHPETLTHFSLEQ